MAQVIRFPLVLDQQSASVAETSTPAIRIALQSAWHHVREGDWMAARAECAAALAVHQPALVQDLGLLLDTVTVLAAARGFRLIERLVASTTGRTVRISVGRAQGAAPPHGEHQVFNEACFRDPWLLRQWAGQLLMVPAA